MQEKCHGQKVNTTFYGAYGKYYSFFLKGGYEKIGSSGSSVYKYANKCSKSAKKQHQVDCQAFILESLLATSLADFVSLLSKFIPSFKLLLFPFITSAIKL